MSNVRAQMTTLVGVVPKFAEEVRAGLASAGRDDLAAQVSTLAIRRCTTGDEDEVAYIYCSCPPPSPHFRNAAAPVANTISFYQEAGFLVDVNHDGFVFGIELLDREEVVATLRAANAL